MNMTGKMKSYVLKFKQSVIKYAEENSNREAGRKFSIDESMVRRWRKKSSEINDKSSSKSKKRRLSDGGRKKFLGDQVFLDYSIPDFNSPFRKINAASIQERLSFKDGFYSRKYGNAFVFPDPEPPTISILYR